MLSPARVCWQEHVVTVKDKVLSWKSSVVYLGSHIAEDGKKLVAKAQNFQTPEHMRVRKESNKQQIEGTLHQFWGACFIALWPGGLRVQCERSPLPRRLLHQTRKACSSPALRLSPFVQWIRRKAGRWVAIYAIDERERDCDGLGCGARTPFVMNRSCLSQLAVREAVVAQECVSTTRWRQISKLDEWLWQQKNSRCSGSRSYRSQPTVVSGRRSCQEDAEMNTTVLYYNSSCFLLWLSNWIELNKMKNFMSFCISF